MARTMFALLRRALVPRAGTYRAVGTSRCLCTSTTALASKPAAPPRHPGFAQMQGADVDVFQSVVGKANAILDAERLETHGVDWMKTWRGHPSAVLRPRNTGMSLSSTAART